MSNQASNKKTCKNPLCKGGLLSKSPVYLDTPGGAMGIGKRILLYPCENCNALHYREGDLCQNKWSGVLFFKNDRIITRLQ